MLYNFLFVLFLRDCLIIPKQSKFEKNDIIDLRSNLITLSYIYIDVNPEKVTVVG